MLSHVLYKKAKILRQNEEDRHINLKNALNVLNDTIDKFDSIIAYYNKACTISLIGHYGVLLEPVTEFNDIPSAALEALTEAIGRSRELLIHSLSDTDLKWIRQNHTERFELIVGHALMKHHSR